jgi:hypothetical protein
VVAVSFDGKHCFSKASQPSITLTSGHGIEGDAHYGPFVRHRYLARRNPNAPNRRGGRYVDPRFGLVEHGPLQRFSAIPSGSASSVNAKSDDDEDTEGEDQNLNFRDLLKSRSLRLSVPTQIVWPTLWDDSAKIPRKLKETLREVQDPATRAWNLLNAIFYKAGKVPWKLPKAEDAFAASFLGIGFYKDLSGQRLLTSTAQMFDERGRGLILRGARARTDRGDRHPYLDREDAYDLLVRAIKAYRDHHGHAPARLVILKTSRFQDGEADGSIPIRGLPSGGRQSS